ncbi:TIGR02996 domain-containing protein [Corallococcus terminator]
MSHVLKELLGRAEEALARREDDAALTHLLEAWKECRAEPVIALIQRLSDHLAAGLPFFEVPVRWLLEDVRRHPTDLPRVLGALRERAASLSRCAFSTDLDRLRRWWPADPRIIPLLLTLVRLPGAETPGELKMLCSLFMYVGAPYDLEPLRALKARLPSTQGEEVERFDLVLRLGARWVPPVLDAETLARCDALKEVIEARVEHARPSAATREALFARVYDAPEEDSARLVLADQLLEQGDPLGEFIMLQHAKAPDEERIARLLAANRERWEAPLGPYIERGYTRFERGFPVAVRPIMGDLFPKAFPKPEPGWNTVEEINWNPKHPGDGNDAAHWGRMLRHPALRRVARLLNVPGETASFLSANNSVRRLELKDSYAKGLADALTALPHLTWLAAPYTSLDLVIRCAHSQLASQLEYFEASGEDGDWRLEMTRGAEVPLRATVRGPRVRKFAPVLLAAARFSSQGLRIEFQDGAEEQGGAPLREALAAYARVIRE